MRRIYWKNYGLVERHHGKFGRMSSRNVFLKVFNEKTVLVTGHTGFIGTWLCLWLKTLGAKITGYSLEPPTNPSLFETIGLEKEITSITGDIRDEDHIHECFEKCKPEFVFHLAAQPLVLRSYENPVETFETNVMGTVNLLECIRHISGVKACIILTSDKCYENRGSDYAYKENDPMGGYDPYSASKGATELITASYRRSFFKNSENNQVGISTVRAGNVIGGGDWSEYRIIPDCIRALVSKQPILVRNPTAVRPWQHVLEPVSGILCLATKMWEDPLHFSEAWNIGPLLSNNKVTVKEIVDMIIHEWGNGSWIDTSEKNLSAQHESNLLLLDSSKAINGLQWHPVYSVKEAIKHTISWYKAHTDHKIKMNDFSLDQINDYTKKAKELNIAWAQDYS